MPGRPGAELEIVLGWVAARAGEITPAGTASATRPARGRAIAAPSAHVRRVTDPRAAGAPPTACPAFPALGGSTYRACLAPRGPCGRPGAHSGRSRRPTSADV